MRAGTIAATGVKGSCGLLCHTEDTFIHQYLLMSVRTLLQKLNQAGTHLCAFVRCDERLALLFAGT